METFEEMKQRYQADMLRYAKRARIEAPPPEQMQPTVPRAVTQPQPEPLQSVASPDPVRGPEIRISAQAQTDAAERLMLPADSRSAVPNTEETPDRLEGDNGIGTLIVRTSTAREALPLEGALVIVSRYIGDQPTLQWMGLTDISGNTVRIPLPAPDEGRSERPGDNRPYASYIIQAVKDGYYTAEFRNVPVFAGVTAVQPVEMVPLPVQGSSVPQMIVVEHGPDL